MAMTMRAPQVSSRATSRAAPVRRAARVVCSAQQPQNSVQQAGSFLAAAAIAAAVSFGSVEAAKADIAGLTPCSESKAYAKRLKQEVKSLEKRKKLYAAGSAPALALDATIGRTEARFANYAKANTLCGTDGLPHLISDPGLALRFGHSGETLIPTVGFLYVAGYIGYVGRAYIMAIKKQAKPETKEIIIDVPFALSLVRQGAGWPLATIQELRNGTLTEKDENITVSPR